jgi:hypothetical protein
MIKFVRLKDAFTRRATMINTDKVQLLEDATEASGPKGPHYLWTWPIDDCGRVA